MIGNNNKRDGRTSCRSTQRAGEVICHHSGKFCTGNARGQLLALPSLQPRLRYPAVDLTPEVPLPVSRQSLLLPKCPEELQECILYGGIPN